MIKAIWNSTEIAASTDTVTVEGNHYFPPGDVSAEHLQPSDTRTHCHWKGEAHYYHVVSGDQVNRDAAWFYPDPKDAAEHIRDHIAFWRGVQVIDTEN
ncbi:MAG: DUF427 domain-containing protein [Xanthomonadales bacterium]|nr:DUF427 domain-containing protein [Xanthomonadales bacterium]